MLSCLTYWCGLFSEVKYLPLFVFPFLKVFGNDPFSCFEALVTIIVNWCQHWFEYFPYSPVNTLAMIENVLAEHDPVLLEHFYELGITTRDYAWPLLEVAFSEVLCSSDWLKFWDHVLSNEPAFLLIAVVAFNIVCRSSLKICNSPDACKMFFHKQSSIDFKQFISKTYQMCSKTSADIHPRQYLKPFQPLSQGTYPIMSGYPKFVLDKINQSKDLREEEENLLKEKHNLLKTRINQQKRAEEEEKFIAEKERLEKLEDAYREVIQKEEDRVALKRQKIMALRKELRAKEIEFLESSRNQILKQNTKQRTKVLNRLMEDITRKREKEEHEIALTEEEIEQQIGEILAQKQKIEQELSNSCREEQVPDDQHKALEKMQKQLHQEIQKLHKESALERSKLLMDIPVRIAKINEFLQKVELELAQEMAAEELQIATGQRQLKVAELEKKTKYLEQEVINLVNQLTELKLEEGEKTLNVVVQSFDEQLKLNCKLYETLLPNYRTKDCISTEEENKCKTKKTTTIPSVNLNDKHKRVVDKSFNIRNDILNKNQERRNQL